MDIRHITYFHILKAKIKTLSFLYVIAHNTFRIAEIIIIGIGAFESLFKSYFYKRRGAMRFDQIK
jgi:hypothetical protein